MAGGHISMGVGKTLDLSNLSVGFGGFAPTDLTDGSSRARVEACEALHAARREALEHAKALEAARTSECRRFEDAAGNVWDYVVLDESAVRIEHLEAHTEAVAVPAEIEGMPVVALADDACARQPDLKEIVCAETIITIGYSAFRQNPQLERVVLPPLVATFDSHWFRDSTKIRHLTLSGQLERITANVFDLPALETLQIGAGTSEVYPGAFAKSCLRTISVDADNPFMMTDGHALYSADGATLIVLTVPADAYVVQPGCIALAKKALSGFNQLVRVEIPESLEIVGAFAYAGTSIERFVAPASLRLIAEKAFFNCACLTEVQLNAGLEEVGAHAFSGTNLHQLELPASLCRLAYPVAAGCDLTYAGPDATFRIASGAQHLIVDEQGALYAKAPDGLHLERMMNPDACTYEALAGTVVVEPGAFASHKNIQAVKLPLGVQRIGRGAFKGCTALEHVRLPEGLIAVETEAFMDTGLVDLTLPSTLIEVGLSAFITHGAHHGMCKPSFTLLSVAPGNTRFKKVPGMLLEHRDDGSDRVVLGVADTDILDIPATVVQVMPYAFNDLPGIRQLYLTDALQSIGARGLALGCAPELICIRFTEPIEGHDYIEVRFPRTDRGAQQMSLALSVSDRVNPALILEHYDNAIINASSFDSKAYEGLPLYQQTRLLVARLADPFLMKPANVSMARQVLSANIEKICVALTKHDDRATVTALIDLGFVNAENIATVIERVSAIQDAAMIGYLLEVQRLRFGVGALDFEL